MRGRGGIVRLPGAVVDKCDSWRFLSAAALMMQPLNMKPWEFVSLILWAESLTRASQWVFSFILQLACSCRRFTHFPRSKLIADHTTWLEFQCSKGKSRSQDVRPIVGGHRRAFALADSTC